MDRRDDIYDGMVEGTAQLDPAESLTGQIGEDPLDAGWSPPDREPVATRWDSTEYDVIHGETLEQRLAEEEPDVSEDDLDGYGRQQRAGRLASDGGSLAHDVGRGGWAASAEEAAMHVIDDEDDGSEADYADDVLPI